MVCLAARKRSRHRDGPMGGAKHLPYNIGALVASVILKVHVAQISYLLCGCGFVCAREWARARVTLVDILKAVSPD